MSDKPSYLGLLNAISVNESRAYAYLSAWADVTPHDGVRDVLRTVAAREGEHGMSFAKRINELGYQLRPKDDQAFDRQLAVARSDRTDLEKFEALGVLRVDGGDGPDVFDSFFTDHSIDIRTGELLGRYIAEERDSLRLLRGCYDALRANGDDADSMNDAFSWVAGKLDAVSRAVDELRQIVVAQFMPSSPVDR
jgi:hypothetical protein